MIFWSRLIRAFVLLFLFCMASDARADDRDKEPFTMIGLATDSCGAFLQAMEGERKARLATASPDDIYTRKYGGYLDFADGFISGANYSDTQPNRMIGQDSDHAGRMAWLENYCHRDPLSSYGHAVFALRKHLERH
jgi:hypothetical protein